MSSHDHDPASPGGPAGAETPGDVVVRGIAFYVGVDRGGLDEPDKTLRSVATELGKLVRDLVPSAQVAASVALVPVEAEGASIELVRRALRSTPGSGTAEENGIVPVGSGKTGSASSAPGDIKPGVTIDISRKLVQLDGVTVHLTFTEYELLQFLVLREGRVVSRAEILEGLWGGLSTTVSDRAVDVHIRRLRRGLGSYEDIIRTARGVGYRFDRQSDVTIVFSGVRSPDML